MFELTFAARWQVARIGSAGGIRIRQGLLTNIGDRQDKFSR